MRILNRQFYSTSIDISTTCFGFESLLLQSRRNRKDTEALFLESHTHTGDSWKRTTVAFADRHSTPAGGH